MLNWIERRALREEHLRNASTVWQAVKSSIDECCNSFRQKFIGVARLSNKEQNGHRIFIEVRPTYEPNNPRQISIKFEDDEEKQITVTVGGGRAMIFSIDADDSHAFIKYGNEEISADEFTRHALEEALFESPSPRHSPVQTLGNV
jgi:hypothetical protein